MAEYTDKRLVGILFMPAPIHTYDNSVYSAFRLFFSFPVLSNEARKLGNSITATALDPQLSYIFEMYDNDVNFVGRGVGIEFLVRPMGTSMRQVPWVFLIQASPLQSSR